ncbi:hypothetical protein Peetri_00064 [Pseudomonas phage vB_PpuM-Peetri]
MDGYHGQCRVRKMKVSTKRRIIYWAPSALILLASMSLVGLAAHANTVRADEAAPPMNPEIHRAAMTVQAAQGFNGNANPLALERPTFSPEVKAKMDVVMNQCPVDSSLKQVRLFRYSEGEVPAPSMFDAICSLLVLPPDVQHKSDPMQWRKFTQVVTPVSAEILIEVDSSQPQNDKARFLFQQVLNNPDWFQLVEVKSMKVKGTALERTVIFQIQQSVGVYYDMLAAYVNQQGKPVVKPIPTIQNGSRSTDNRPITMLTAPQ